MSDSETSSEARSSTDDSSEPSSSDDASDSDSDASSTASGLDVGAGGEPAHPPSASAPQPPAQAETATEKAARLAQLRALAATRRAEFEAAEYALDTALNQNAEQKQARLEALRASEEAAVRQQAEVRARVRAIKAAQVDAVHRAAELRDQLREHEQRQGQAVAPLAPRATAPPPPRAAAVDEPPAAEDAALAARRRAADALAGRFRGLGALDALIARPAARAAGAAGARDAERARLRARIDEVVEAPVDKLLRAVDMASATAALTDSPEVQLGAQRRAHKAAAHARHESMRRQNAQRKAFADKQRASADERARGAAHAGAPASERPAPTPRARRAPADQGVPLERVLEQIEASRHDQAEQVRSLAAQLRWRPPPPAAPTVASALEPSATLASPPPPPLDESVARFEAWLGRDAALRDALDASALARGATQSALGTAAALLEEVAAEVALDVADEVARVEALVGASVAALLCAAAAAAATGASPSRGRAVLLAEPALPLALAEHQRLRAVRARAEPPAVRGTVQMRLERRKGHAWAAARVGTAEDLAHDTATSDAYAEALAAARGRRGRARAAEALPREASRPAPATLGRRARSVRGRERVGADADDGGRGGGGLATVNETPTPRRASPLGGIAAALADADAEFEADLDDHGAAAAAAAALEPLPLPRAASARGRDPAAGGGGGGGPAEGGEPAVVAEAPIDEASTPALPTSEAIQRFAGLERLWWEQWRLSGEGGQRGAEPMPSATPGREFAAGVTAAAYAPRGSLLALGFADGSAAVYDASHSPPLLRWVSSALRSAAPAPAAGGSVRGRRAAASEAMPLSRLAWSADGRALAAVSAAGWVALFSLAPPSTLRGAAATVAAALSHEREAAAAERARLLEAEGAFARALADAKLTASGGGGSETVLASLERLPPLFEDGAADRARALALGAKARGGESLSPAAQGPVPVYELALLALVAPSQLGSDALLARAPPVGAAGAAGAAGSATNRTSRGGSQRPNLLNGLGFGRRRSGAASADGAETPGAAVPADALDLRAMSICFHPAMTLGGAQPAVVVGLGCGAGVKLNTPGALSTLTGRPPLSVTPLRPPSAADAAAAARLGGGGGGGGGASGGGGGGLGGSVLATERLSSELLSGGHTAPIVFCGIAGAHGGGGAGGGARGGVSTLVTLVTLDAAGAIRLWPYSAERVEFNCLTAARGGARLQLSEPDFGPQDGTEQVLFPPPSLAVPPGAEPDRDKQFHEVAHTYDANRLASFDFSQPWREARLADGATERVFGRPDLVLSGGAGGSAEFTTIVRARDGTLLSHRVQSYGLVERASTIADAALTACGRELLVLLYFPPDARTSPLAYARLVLVDLTAGVRPTPLRVTVPLGVGTTAATPPPALALGGALAQTAADYAYILHGGTLQVYSLASGQLVKGPLPLGKNDALLDRLALAPDHSSLLLGSSSAAEPALLVRAQFVPPSRGSAEAAELRKLDAQVRAGSWRAAVVPADARARGVGWRFARRAELPATRHVQPAAVVRTIVDELVARAFEVGLARASAPKMSRRPPSGGRRAPASRALPAVGEESFGSAAAGQRGPEDGVGD